MRPTRSYWIWFSQRNGSTALCGALRDTGRAGDPGELFLLGEGETLCGKYGVSTYGALREQLWATATPNGVVGLKYGMHAAHFTALVSELAVLQGMSQDTPGPTVFADLLPACAHVFLTRRNKVRQAVSWWRAIQDGVWHLERGEDRAAHEVGRYDSAALRHLLLETNLREAAVDAYLSAHDLPALTLCYEELVRDPTAAVGAVLALVGEEAPGDVVLGSRPTASAESEVWVQRLRAELQADWDVRVW